MAALHQQRCAHIALRLSEREGARQWFQRGHRVSLRFVSQCLLDENLNGAAGAPTRFGGDQEPVQQHHSLLQRPFQPFQFALRQANSGQGDVVEFAQIGEVIVYRETLGGSPALRFS